MLLSFSLLMLSVMACGTRLSRRKASILKLVSDCGLNFELTPWHTSRNLTHWFFLVFASFDISTSSCITNFSPLFIQSHLHSIESNEDKDEDDKETEGALVKGLVFDFYLDIAQFWKSTTKTQGKHTQSREHPAFALPLIWNLK
jgi:hypothetical protein